MKYAYTGEAEMATNRVHGFLEAAKSLEMYGLMDKEEIHAKRSKNRRSSAESQPIEPQATAKRGGGVDDEPDAKHARLDVVTSINVVVEKPEMVEASRKRKTNGEDFSDELGKRAKVTDYDEDLRYCQHCLRRLDTRSAVEKNRHEMFCVDNPNQLLTLEDDSF